MPDSNLLVTFDPSREGKAKAEVEQVLLKLKVKPKFLKSSVDGLFMIQVSKPKEVVKKLTASCKKNSDMFEVTFHYIPIEKWISSSLKTMQVESKKLGMKIGKQERWKMNLTKRNYDGDSRQLIVKLTEPIDKLNVNLSDPQKIVQVEIIGKKAGFSLLEPSELLIVPKLKR